MRRSLVALVLLCASTAALAEWSLNAHADSELVHRGASLGEDKPALGVSGSFDWRSGWFAGGSAFYAGRPASGPQLNEYLRAHVGWFSELRDGRALELSVTRIEFPNADSWDYTEARGDFHLSHDTSLMVAFSPDYYGRDAGSLLVGGTWRPRFGSGLYVLVSAGGGYMAGSRDTGIAWGEAGVGFSTGRVDISAMIGAVDSASARILVTPESTVAVRVSFLIL